MSYNTRRQGGVGRGTSQVMYHQQGGNPRSTGPIKSGSPVQNTQGYSSYSSQSSGGNYSSGGNPGYSTQQYQQQHQQQQQAPVSQVPPPPLPPVLLQQSPVSKPLHGILKTETSSPASQAPVKTPSVEVEDNAENISEEGEDGETKPKPAWMKKKQLGFKVNKVVKRRRQNARLRKLLQPKNAVMVLNELVTGVQFTVQEHASQLKFQASTEINGKVYNGQALSKTLAKQIAAENALKAIFLEKISNSPLKIGMSALEKSEDTTAMSDDGEENVSTDKSSNVMEDDVPWKSLTSFAIYKLFLEWQREGIPVPLLSNNSQQSHNEHTSKPMKKVPENPTERHPVMLLVQMSPGIEFTEVSRVGNPPEIMFTMQTIVDNTTYTGSGKTKKEAKKEAAISALAGAFDIHYP